MAGLVNGMLRQGLPRASINFGVSEKDPKGAAIGMAIFGFRKRQKDLAFLWPFAALRWGKSLGISVGMENWECNG